MNALVNKFFEHIGGVCIGLFIGLPVSAVGEPVIGALVFTMVASGLVLTMPERS